MSTARAAACVRTLVEGTCSLRLHVEHPLEQQENDRGTQTRESEDNEHELGALGVRERTGHDVLLDVLGAVARQHESGDRSGDQLGQGIWHARNAHECALLTRRCDAADVRLKLGAPDELAASENQDLGVDHGHVGALERRDTEGAHDPLRR